MAFCNTAKQFLLFIFACLSVTGNNIPAAAQNRSDEYTIRHYTDEDGLPQNSVRSIRPDDDGFIWMSTEDGIARFDGNNFFIFNSDNTAITSNRFIFINRDKDRGAIYSYNLSHEYVRISDGKAIRDTTGAEYENIGRFQQKVEQLRKLNLSIRETYITPTGNGNFYLYDSNSVSFYNNGQRAWTASLPIDVYLAEYERWRFFILDRLLFNFTPEGAIIALDKGKLLNYTFSGDILRDKDYKSRHKAIRFIPGTSEKYAFISFRNTLYKVIDRGGTLETHQLVSGFDFEENKIACAHLDTLTGNIFLGSQTNGLYVFNRKKFHVITAGSNESDKSLYAQAIYNDHTVFVPQGSLLGDGISQKLFKGDAPLYTQYTAYTDRKGYIWLLSSSGLDRLNHNLKPAGIWQLPGAGIVIHGGFANNLWIGTREGIILRFDTETLQPPTPIPVKIPGISYFIQEDKNILWAAARPGLYRIHLDDMKVDTVRGLNTQYVRSLYLPQPGQLWITTYENGIYLYTPENLVHFPLDNDHFLMAAHCIMEDKRGYFWITTNKGLFQVAKKDLLDYAAHRLKDVFYLYYSKSNGFNTNEFNGGCQPCGVMMPDGDISLPTLNGLVWFSSANFKEELPDKKIFIDKAEINGKTAPDPNEIIMQQRTGRLNIWVSTPYFGDRRNVHIFYGLTTKDHVPVFQKLPVTGIIPVQNLSPGEYILYIRKINGFGRHNYIERKIHISVPYYWYQTNWFFTAVTILALAGIFLFINARTRYLLRKNRRLEVMIHKRTLKLEQALRSLKASQDAQAKQTFIQERLIAAISHDIRTPLKYLSLFNRKIYDQLQSLTTDPHLLEMSKSAADSSSRMQHYLGNLLQYIKSSLHKGNVKNDRFNLYTLVHEHTSMLESIAHANKTTIQNNIFPDLRIHTNRQLLAIILHNLIDNAVKITIEGNIKISASQEGNKTEIIIADNGGGISAELQQWLNETSDVFENTPGGENRKGSSGMGLFIVKELSALIGAQLKIVSDNKTYTEVHITLSDPQ
ncbi:ATP-binding protein [Chitinophagaceae bacterium MMS25-I14]